MKERPTMNHFRTPRPSHAIRLHPRGATLAALALLLFAVVAPAGAQPGNDNRAPNLSACPNLQVPSGHKVAFHVYAAGVQIYRWNAAAMTWDFVAPDARLFANAGGNGAVGTHYAGPTWESVSGSKVVGGMPVERCFPNANAIPWLRIPVARTEGAGVFARVTYIQRVNTTGGTAPTLPGLFPGEEKRVPYTTEYVFYRKQP
jgi:hypothetical protein